MSGYTEDVIPPWERSESGTPEAMRCARCGQPVVETTDHAVACPSESGTPEAILSADTADKATAAAIRALNHADVSVVTGIASVLRSHEALRRSVERLTARLAPFLAECEKVGLPEDASMLVRHHRANAGLAAEGDKRCAEMERDAALESMERLTAERDQLRNRNEAVNYEALSERRRAEAAEARVAELEAELITLRSPASDT